MVVVVQRERMGTKGSSSVDMGRFLHTRSFLSFPSNTSTGVPRLERRLKSANDEEGVL